MCIFIGMHTGIIPTTPKKCRAPRNRQSGVRYSDKLFFVINSLSREISSMISCKTD